MVDVLTHLTQRFPHGIRRVLLVNPPSVAEADFRLDMVKDRRYWSYPPMGCAILAGALNSHGYESRILDLNVHMLSHNVYTSWRDMLAASVDDFQPDLVGVSVMFTMAHEPLRLIAQECHRLGVPVCAGGLHPTNARREVLRDIPELEFIGLYESDLSFTAILDAINGKGNDIAQVALNIDGEYVAVEKRLAPKLGEIGRPDWTGIDLTQYDAIGQVGTYHFLRDSHRKASSVLAKRGCRAHCSFCSVRAFNGIKVRERPVDDVLDEICELKAKGIGHITWLDDDLLYDQRASLELFNGIANIGGMTWDASNGLIAGAITEELLDAMVASGCVGFNLGIESGDDAILRAVHKPGNTAAFRRCAELCKKYPQLFIKAFILCCLPNETLAQMKKTIDLCVELQYDWCAIQIFQPLIGTESYRQMADQGFMADNIETDGKKFTAGVFSSLNLRKREESRTAEFHDPFTGDLNRVPEKDEMADVWMAMDLRMNYLPILNMTDTAKLINKKKILTDVCDRITRHNPLGNLFLSEVLSRLGEHDASHDRLVRATEYLNGSAYWQKFFTAMDYFKKAA